MLSAIATGTTGIKTSYEKNFFDQQTRSAVGLSDVDAYYQKGTIFGALQSIAESAGTQQQTATDQQKKNGTAQQLF